jgi:phosphatidylglycerol---prolipoprotein diacylglyceryl transferase
MSKQTTPSQKAWWQTLPRFWYIVAIFTLITTLIYAYHLATGFTPDRVAISIFGLEIYWYGVIIVTGIATGAYVASFLADERARAIFTTAVSPTLHQRPISTLRLTSEASKKLRQNNIEHLSDLILYRGYSPKATGLSREETELLDKRLLAINGFDPTWLTNAPWRQWYPDHVWSGIVWILIFGIIGARFYHILTPSPSMAQYGIESAWDYFQQPMQMINLRNGGLGIYGALFGGLFGLALYCWRQNISLLNWADLGAVGLALGQYFGRWGNFFNQELYGSPTTLPWGLTLDNPLLAGYTADQRFHPAFLYESIWNFLVFLLLYVLARRYSHKLLPGDLMALYGIGYGVGRILLETVRLDSRLLSLGDWQTGMPVATAVGLLIIITMLIWRGIAHYLHRRQTTPRS